jgi:hypothetical protein
MEPSYLYMLMYGLLVFGGCDWHDEQFYKNAYFVILFKHVGYLYVRLKCVHFLTSVCCCETSLGDVRRIVCWYTCKL